MTPHLRRRVCPFLFAAALGFLATGCANSPYEVKVDAITKPVATNARSYKLKSKNPALGDENLRYREAADFVKTALSGKGMYEASSEDKADMIVELDYGMDTPRTKTDRVSVPVYGQVGGGVRYESVPVIDGRGNTIYQQVAVYEPSRPEIIGYDDMPRQVTIYQKYLRITARENKAASEGRPPAEIWSVQASAEDESNDLRKYLPIMASASIDYIGRDSNDQKVVKVRDDAPEVVFIRKGLPDSAGAAVPQPPTAPKI